MEKFIKRLSMVPKGVRYKLMIAFSLMFVIPLLACGYLVNYFLTPIMQSVLYATTVFFFIILVGFLGLILAKRLVDPVIDMALEARIIASGDYDRKIQIDREDEIGELGKSINTISKQIKEYMGELHSYSIRTKDMNIEIQKKILALTNLLQIGDMIAGSEDLDNILELVVEKVTELFEGSTSALYMLKEGKDEFELRASHNEKGKNFKSLELKLGKGYLGRAMGAKIIVAVEGTTKMSPDLEAIQKDFQTKNCLILPIVVRRNVAAFLFNGNDADNFRYNEDEVELIKVLAKQIGIAIENDLLLRKAEELAFRDDLTGLYNESFIKARLDEEIHRAILCQRPCSFLIFNVDNFNVYREAHGQMPTEEILKRIADVIKQNSTEIGRVARLSGDEFAVVLPEKNKREASKIADDIRLKTKEMCSKTMGKDEKPLTISGGVSENPIDGSSAEELFDKASTALKTAKKEGKNKISA